MFYNGLHQIVYRSSICIFLATLFFDSFSGLIWTNINKTALNDSLYVLYLLSSSVSTIWIFLYILCFLIIFKEGYRMYLTPFILIISLHFGIYYDSGPYVSNFFKIGPVNTSLQNGLVNVHPIIIYYFYAYLILLSTKMLNKAKITHYFEISTTSMYHQTLLLSLGVTLGALWAAQELNWGGLWSWDPVEMLSILLALYLLKILHKPSQYIQKNYSLLWLVVTSGIIVLILRLGVLTTVHSFVKSNTTPAHVRLSILFITTLCLYLLGVNIVRYVRSSSLMSNTHGGVLYSVALISVYSYLLYLFVSVTTNLWKYISFDVSVLSCLILISYSFYRLLMYVKIYVRTYIRLVLLTSLVYLYCNFIPGTIILIALSIGLSDSFVNKLKSIHKYIVIIYIVYFCIVTNLVLSLTQIKPAIDPGLHFSVGFSIESMYGFYESFISLNKQLVITKVKSLTSHVQGFSAYSNGLWTTFNFSKNQNSFCLFGVEYIGIVMVYIFCIGFFNINYQIRRAAEAKYY